MLFDRDELLRYYMKGQIELLIFVFVLMIVKSGAMVKLQEEIILHGNMQKNEQMNY
jgi:hypothetical protein